MNNRHWQHQRFRRTSSVRWHETNDHKLPTLREQGFELQAEQEKLRKAQEAHKAAYHQY